MITDGQWKRWKDNSTTDDRLNTYVLSDIRQMLGEIERLRDMVENRDEFIAGRGLWKEFGQYLSEPHPAVTNS